MNEFMGVRVDPVDEEIEGNLDIVTSKIQVSGKVAVNSTKYVLDGRLNASFKAVNLLLEKGIAVSRADTLSDELHPGDFIVSSGSEPLLKNIAEETGVDFLSLKQETALGTHEVKKKRTGMYQRYWGGNMDEGWTRFLLEQFSFPYTTLKDVEIKKGNLIKNYEVIILPNDSTAMITGVRTSSSRRYSETSVPPEYRSGLGCEGVEALLEFVRSGGTLVTLGEACMFAIEKFGLDVINSMENLESKEFSCPGSTLKVKFDNTHPLAYGMPSEGLVLYWSSPAFAIAPGQYNELYDTVVRYKDKDLLQSGWLIGEQHLVNLSAMVNAQFGKGQVVLIGFRTQNRSQTHGTFKLLFNTMIR